jgi:nucleoside-specific outer membrane channel protein Tsx
MSRMLLSCLCVSILSASPAGADGPIRWHSENVQILKGFNYELGPEERTIITVEHAHRSDIGDLFLFTDFTFEPDGDIQAYGEITPRLSLSRLTGRDWRAGAVSDVLLAANYERGEGGVERYLAGAAIDLDIEGFRFVRVHAFLRDDPSRSGTTGQLSIAWNRPFEIGGEAFLAEGFADLAGAEGNGVANQLLVPRLLWDIGAHHGAAGRVYLGLEWQYWHNKFGVDGVTESVPQIQLKWVLH